MRIFKWSPDFRPDIESSIAPIWLSFPKLPVHFFSKSALFSIAQLIGKPVKLDTSTVEINRSSMARVCVETDLQKKIPRRVWIGCGSKGFWQEVQHEEMPLYYNHCLKKGHNLESCIFLNVSTNLAIENVTVNKQSMVWKEKSSTGVNLERTDKAGEGETAVNLEGLATRDQVLPNQEYITKIQHCEISAQEAEVIDHHMLSPRGSELPNYECHHAKNKGYQSDSEKKKDKLKVNPMAPGDLSNFATMFERKWSSIYWRL